MKLLPASTAAVCPYTGGRVAGEPRGTCSSSPCVWWHCASPEEAGRAHGCAWAAGEVGAGDTRPCRTVELAQPLFTSVSSADGGSGSAWP